MPYLYPLNYANKDTECLRLNNDSIAIRVSLTGGWISRLMIQVWSLDVVEFCKLQFANNCKVVLDAFELE